jgi:uncharacterized OB-fold protein
MSDVFAGVTPMVYESRISVPYHWWAGDTATAFLRALRDEQTIRGLKCDSCGKVYVPPRKVCPRCFVDATEWVDLSGEGQLQTFTTVRRQRSSLSRPVPVIFGLVLLDGADTALLHHIEEVEPKDLRAGLRLKAHFAENRQGRITDITGFRPIQEGP